MSLSDAVTALFNKPKAELATDPGNEIKSRFFSSKRFILVIAAVAFIFLTYTLLNIEILKIIGNIVMVYIAGESLTNAVTAAGNAYVKSKEVIHDIEYERLAAANPKPVTPKAP